MDYVKLTPAKALLLADLLYPSIKKRGLARQRKWEAALALRTAADSVDSHHMPDAYTYIQLIEGLRVRVGKLEN